VPKQNEPVASQAARDRCEKLRRYSYENKPQTENMIATKSTRMRKEKQDCNISGPCRFALFDSWFRVLFVSFRAFSRPSFSV
jgi:hypothetical protein